MKYYSREEVEKIGRAGALVRIEGDVLFCRFLSSFWLACEPDDNAFTPHAKHDGYWEAWNTKWVSQELDSNDMFVDIGANVGYYTMLAAQHGLQTLSFEPNSSVRELLKISLLENRLSDRVFVSHYALSNYEGQANLFSPEGHSGAASLSEEGVPVQVARGDTFFEDVVNRNILFKCDAEGAEPKIWEGLRATWETNNCTMFLEWDSRRYDAQAFADQIFNYSVHMVDDDGSEKHVSKDWLVNSNDLYTIIVRNNT